MKKPATQPLDPEAFLEISRSTAMEYARQAIRGCILINGGAAAGLVAFLPSAKMANMRIDSLASALVFFGWGALLGVASFGLSYIAQVYVTEAFPASAEQKRNFRWLRYAAVGAAISSGIAFVLGMYAAAGSIEPLVIS